MSTNKKKINKKKLKRKIERVEYVKHMLIDDFELVCNFITTFLKIEMIYCRTACKKLPNPFV